MLGHRKALITIGWLATIFLIISCVAFEVIRVLEGKGSELYTSHFGLKGMPLGVVILTVAVFIAVLIVAAFKIKESLEVRDLLRKYGNAETTNENQPNK